MPATRSRQALDPLAASKRRAERSYQAERIWYGLVTIVAVLVIVASAVVAGAVSPVTCSACHGAQAKTLRATAHKDVSCDQCHAGSTVFGLMQSRLQTVDMLAWQLVPGRQNVPATIDQKRCLRCHAAEMSRTTVVKGIRMNHADLVVAGWRCERCHPATAHAARPVEVGYTMDLCMQCHSADAKQLSTCETCHTDRDTGGPETDRTGAPKTATPWRVIHGPNWKQAHGMGDLKTCKGCHPSDYCVQCHNINVPHPDGYLSQHGSDVLSRVTGDQDCLLCHKRDACDGCHGIEMPHSNDFFKGHSAIVKRDGSKSCETCHAKKSCETCHARHTHPGLPPAQRDWLRAHPVAQ